MSEISELERIKTLMSELGISAQKSFGQNFLINEGVINKIVNHFEITDQEVIEIGPGLGALTMRIRAQTKKITLLEIDKKIIEFWQNNDESVIAGDALKYDWSSLDKSCQILISNLPYQISAPLVINLSSFQHPINKMVLMFQKEVAQRISASPNNKSYGIISVLAQNIWNIKKVADLSQRDFHPSPKILSRVLAFELKVNSKFMGKKYLSFVKHCFQNRRKLLLNKVVTYGKSIGLDKPKVESKLECLEIDLKARAENVSPQDFIKLYESLLAGV